MDIRSIRHDNLLRLVREAGGQKRLAARSGVSAAYLSQVLSRKVNRHVGHSLARRLEAGMDKPYGWMDVLPTGTAAAPAGALREVDDPALAYGRGRVEGARRRAAWRLARASGGPEALAGRAGVHPAYLAWLLEGPAAPPLPADLARRLESAGGRPPGWLDRAASGAS
jgi:transcriptional regulator with XRE-family HTH domain